MIERRWQEVSEIFPRSLIRYMTRATAAADRTRVRGRPGTGRDVWCWRKNNAVNKAIKWLAWLECTALNIFYRLNAPPPGGGGGGTSVIEGDRDVPLDRVWFCRSSILVQGISNRPNVVITIDTGYQIGLLGYGGLLRLSQGHMPIVFYDRPAFQAEARTFFFFFLLVSSAPPIRQGISEVCNIATGYAFECF